MEVTQLRLSQINRQLQNWQHVMTPNLYFRLIKEASQLEKKLAKDNRVDLYTYEQIQAMLKLMEVNNWTLAETVVFIKDASNQLNVYNVDKG